MVTLHHLENARSQRILWLLEELGSDYEIKSYARDPETNLAPTELFAIHPLGKSPWFCGDEFTAADIQMSFALVDAEVRTNLPVEYPHLAEFLKRIRAMTAYRAGIEMGGPYALMVVISAAIRSCLYSWLRYVYWRHRSRLRRRSYRSANKELAGASPEARPISMLAFRCANNPYSTNPEPTALSS